MKTSKMSKRMKLLLAASILGMGASGCANFNSISRSTLAPATGGKIYTVDAKQRHLVMSRLWDGEMRVCAEAAPDVFSAYAGSLAAQGDKSGGQLSLASSETAASISRTQTINLLRESFYRTCERYLSGAISKTQFIIQSARDHRTMVAILAIEQLTGAYRPSSTVISPGGTAASVISGEQAAELIRDYDAKLATATAARKAAEKKHSDAADTVCSTNADKAKPAECEALKAEAEAARVKENEAQKALDNIVELAKNLVNAGAASTTSGSTIQGGGVAASQYDAARMRAVAASVVDIVKLSAIDEGLMFCLSTLTTDETYVFDKLDAKSKSSLVERCLDMIEQSQRKDDLTKATVLSFESTPSEQKLSSYLHAALPRREHQRRTDLALRAMQAAGLGNSGVDLIAILSAGSENDRARLVREIRNIETNAAALKSLE